MYLWCATVFSLRGWQGIFKTQEVLSGKHYLAPWDYRALGKRTLPKHTFHNLFANRVIYLIRTGIKNTNWNSGTQNGSTRWKESCHHQPFWVLLGKAAAQSKLHYLEKMHVGIEINILFGCCGHMVQKSLQWGPNYGGIQFTLN